MKDKLLTLEITMAEFKKDLSYIKESLDENREQHKEIIENQEAYMREMKEFIEKVISEKADKWVENFLYWSGGIIGTALLIGVLTLLSQAYLHLNK